MTAQQSNENARVVDVYSDNSHTRLRYIFNNNQHIPFRIERYKHDEIKAYLELEDFKS